MDSMEEEEEMRMQPLPQWRDEKCRQRKTGLEHVYEGRKREKGANKGGIEKTKEGYREAVVDRTLRRGAQEIGYRVK